MKLPTGVEVYRSGTDGECTVTDDDGTRPLGTEEELLRFIDDGQLAHYFVGDARTSPERPSNATHKLGVVAPHSAFTPHAHGGEQWLHGPLRDLGHDLLLGPTARARGLFRPDTGQTWLRREGTLLPRQGGKLWLLLTLGSWLRAYAL